MPNENKTSGDTQLNKTAGLSTTRIQSLGDSIFAFAMTLLVLNFKVPATGTLHGTERFLAGLGSHFVVYALSFIALGVLWVAQHNQYNWIHRSNRMFLWINIFFFMFVVLIPFSTDLLATYNSDILSVMFYGGNLIICTSLLYFHWWYATHKDVLVSHHPSEHIVSRIKSRMLFSMSSDVVALVLSFWSVPVAISILILIQILSIAPSATIDKAIIAWEKLRA